MDKNKKILTWENLVALVGKRPFLVERVHLPMDGVAIEGLFEMPSLARLSLEDQVFVAAFIKSHGSIKEMERLFGTSYPSIKNRLNRISEELGFLQIDVPSEADKTEILSQLERGEISLSQALEMLK
jgi:hypothetical protein